MPLTHLVHLTVQLLLDQFCGVQGLNAVVVHILCSRDRAPNHPHHGLWGLPAHLVGFPDVFLKTRDTRHYPLRAPQHQPPAWSRPRGMAAVQASVPEHGSWRFITDPAPGPSSPAPYCLQWNLLDQAHGTGPRSLALGHIALGRVYSSDGQVWERQEACAVYTGSHELKQQGPPSLTAAVAWGVSASSLYSLRMVCWLPF